MTVGERLKKLRESKHLTQEDIASKIGTTKQTIYKYENNIITNIPSDKLEAMAKIFGVSPGFLMGWNDRHTVPVYEAAAGEGRINDGYPTEEYNIALDDDQFLFEASGRSMEPTIMDGDMVVVAAQSVLDYPHQIALVKINGNEATLKRVEIKNDGLMLIADNTAVYSPHFFTAEEVTNLPVMIEGVVVKLIREML